MKSFRIMAVAAGVFVPVMLHAQSTFQNLDFEQATIVPLGGNPFFYSASNALPYWTVYQGSSPVNYVLYDNLTLGSPAVSIHDSLSPVGVQPLEGNYSVVLQHSGVDSTTVGIGQTGLLPANAASIQFYVANYQDLQVSFASNVISLVQIGEAGNYSIYGGNLGVFAGQTELVPEIRTTS